MPMNMELTFSEAMFFSRGLSRIRLDAMFNGVEKNLSEESIRSILRTVLKDVKTEDTGLTKISEVLELIEERFLYEYNNQLSHLNLGARFELVM